MPLQITIDAVLFCFTTPCSVRNPANQSIAVCFWSHHLMQYFAGALDGNDYLSLHLLLD
jgi:hypothetical protein